MAYHYILRAQNVLAAFKILLYRARFVQYKISHAANAYLFRHIILLKNGLQNQSILQPGY